MSPLRVAYLALAVVGAIWPLWHLLPWITENGASFDGLSVALQANPVSISLFWDLIVSASALTLWIVAEVAVRRNWTALWAIPVTFLIGVSCGLPLYLFLRTRPV